MRRTWKMWLGFAISAVALVATLWDVSFRDLLTALAGARLVWFVPAFVAWWVSFGARAARWSLLMGGAPLGTTLHAQNIGYLLNSTLPFRLGELARAYVIGQKTSISTTRALSSVVVERVLDLATVVAMFVVFAQSIPMPRAMSRAALAGGLVVLFMLAVGGLLVWKGRAAEERVLRPVLTRASPALAARVLPKFDELTQGFRVVGSARRMALVAVHTVLVWGGGIVFAYLVMQAFVPGTMEQAGLVVVTANLGGALPSAPGGLGIMQGFAKAALVAPFHVREDAAVAFVFVWSLGQQLFLIALGLVSLARVGMSFSEVRTRIAGAPSTAPAGSP